MWETGIKDLEDDFTFK